MCKTPMTERRRQPQSSSITQNSFSFSFTPRASNNQTRRVRHIKDETEQYVTQNSEGESDQADEVGKEAAPYIKEHTEDWSNGNLIRPTAFHKEKNSSTNNDGSGEFGVASQPIINKLSGWPKLALQEHLRTSQQRMTYYYTSKKNKNSTMQQSGKVRFFKNKQI